MTDREALRQCYRSGQMSAAQFERHCEDDPELRKMVEAKGGDANDRVPVQRRPEDTSPGVKTGATDPIAAMREALEPFATLADKYPDWSWEDTDQLIDDCRDKTVPEMVAHIYKNRKGLAVAPNGHTTPFLTVEEWSRIADFLKDYDFQPRQTSPGQSADVAAMARELALKFRRPFSSEKLIEELLSFAARVAADQRERDAKIAETPDPQLANKTAAQIAAAIRASAKPF